MKNPWLKKNPLMSMWLSSAHTAMARARGPATAAIKRETSKAMTSATTTSIDQLASFWADAFRPATASSRAQAATSRAATPARKKAAASRKAKPRKTG
jgi:hypothetical protein